MFCIKVIDNRDQRRKSLSEWIRKLNNYQVFDYKDANIEQEDTESWQPQIIFLHVGNHQSEALDALENYYKDFNVVGYTADVRTAKERIPESQTTLSKFNLYHKNYINHRNMQPPPPYIQTDFKGYVNAVEKGEFEPEKALCSYDDVLESKLYVLDMLANFETVEEIKKNLLWEDFSDYFKDSENKMQMDLNPFVLIEEFEKATDITIKLNKLLVLRNLFFPE